MTVAMILWRVSTWAPKVYAEVVMPFAQLLQSLRQKDRVLKALKRSIMYTDFSGKSIVFIGFFLITYLFLFTYYLFFLRRSKEAVGLRGVIHRGEEKIMTFTDVLGKIDNFVWGVPLIVLIMGTGIFLTCRLGVLQFRKLGTESVKCRALERCVQHWLQLSVQEISSVLQLLSCWADRELYSGWYWLHASVWRPNMRKACWL